MITRISWNRTDDSLNAKFQKEHEFQTSLGKLKIRGVFPTQEEAALKYNKVRESDPTHDILIGPVGLWLSVGPRCIQDSVC